MFVNIELPHFCVRAFRDQGLLLPVFHLTTNGRAKFYMACILLLATPSTSSNFMRGGIGAAGYLKYLLTFLTSVRGIPIVIQ
jgi:hypothetical protein